MVEVGKIAIWLDEAERLKLESIVTAGNEREAFAFLEKAVYAKVVRIQKAK